MLICIKARENISVTS